MNADSIAGTVTAVLCVVVGLLIIGSALVPIVEHASETTTETETTEEYSGTNTSSIDRVFWIPEEVTVTCSVSDSTTTINGSEYSHAGSIKIGTSGSNINSYITIDSTHAMVLSTVAVGNSGGLTLNEATLTYGNGSLTVAGTTSDSADFSRTVEAVAIVFENVDGMPESETYRYLDSPFTIGSEQKAYAMHGMLITTSTAAADLPEGLTMVLNDNNTATLSFSSGYYLGPVNWHSTVTTTETTTTTSEYAPLYAIIPIMLILSMAYVLIRRF